MHQLLLNTGRGINTRYKEHIWYIKTNNPQSAYATRILHNRHKYGPANETLRLIKPCAKGSRMNNWETMLKQHHYHSESLITEQQTYVHNPLYDCMQASRSQTLGHSTRTSYIWSVTTTHCWSINRTHKGMTVWSVAWHKPEVPKLCPAEHQVLREESASAPQRDWEEK